MSRRLAAVLVAAALVSAACGGDGGDEPRVATSPASQQPSPPGSPSPTEEEVKPQRSVTVAMTDNLIFEPAEVVVKVGGKVTWVNESSMDHTSTADPKKAADPSNVELPSGAKRWNSGFLKEGDRFSLTFDEPGTYRYFCIPHEKVGMLGTITVVE